MSTQTTILKKNIAVPQVAAVAGVSGRNGISMPAVPVSFAVTAAQLKNADEQDLLQKMPFQLTSNILQKKAAGEEDEPLQTQAPFLLRGIDEDEPLQMKPFQLKDAILQKKTAHEKEEALQIKAAPFQLKEPEEDDVLQMRTAPLQLKGIEEEEPLQMKPFQLATNKPFTAETNTRPNNTGIPDKLKAGFYIRDKGAGTVLQTAAAPVVQRQEGDFKKLQVNTRKTASFQAGSKEGKGVIMYGGAGKISIGGAEFNKAEAEDDAFKVTVEEERKEQNAIFGLSGRNKTEIENALAAGYFDFDGADSYEDTSTLLANAIKEKGIKREYIKLIYKVDKTKPAELKSHLHVVAKMFGGWIDEVLVHKSQDVAQAQNYWQVLMDLKKENIIDRAGLGDPSEEMLNGESEADSYEVPADALYENKGSEGLREKLKKKDKPVYVYHVMKTLQKLKADFSKSDFQAFLSKLRNDIPGAVPILSSRSIDKIENNLALAEPDETFGNEIAESYKMIEERMKDILSTAIVAVAEMEDKIKTGLRNIVNSIPMGNWQGEKLSGEDRQTIGGAIEKANFTEVEKKVLYQGVDKKLSLGELLEGLLNDTGNCHAVEAYNFIGAIP